MADHQTLKQGNFQSYGISPYNAYTGMWGLYRNKNLKATSSLLAFPGTFPDGTILTWDVTPDPRWGGVNGYLHVSYGNYDASPGTITPRQVNAIADLAVALDWTFEGNPASGLLSECYLTSAATPSGSLAPTHEVGFLPKLSPAAIAYVKGLPAVGTFTDSYGVAWNVCQGASGGGQPYLIAYRPGYVDFRGTLRFDDFFAFLTASGKTTGAEWFNGVAFGVEPQSGVGSLTVDKFAVTYA